MKTLFTNATVRWNEAEIERRETLIREIPIMLGRAWRGLNNRVRLERVETPILTPGNFLMGHQEAGFELLKVQSQIGPIESHLHAFLRPETTIGTFEAFRQDHPMLEKDLKRWADRLDSNPPSYLPMCYWQAGKSFRDEKNPDTMRATKLRLREFWQMEFQLFCLPGTKADYLTTALELLKTQYGGDYKAADELPHYSKRTLDWFIDDLEVAGCSVRTDFVGLEVHEIAIGLDRLVNLMMKQS